MTNTDIPNAPAKIERRSKDVAWYSPSPGGKLGPAARELLENYSRIPSEEVENHVKIIKRDEAWEIFPYPCIGGFRFLDLAISSFPNYALVLQRLKTGNENFLDLGCCFGQELRKIAADGAPQEHLYGADLRSEFFDLGYQLFNDSQNLKAKFIAADVFDPSSQLTTLYKNIDIIYAGAFLHLFGYAEQLEICKQIVKLLRDKKDSLLLGRQVGNLEAGEKVSGNNKSQNMFRHNEESFRKMWEEVGELTGTKWRVETEMLHPGERYMKERGVEHGPNMRYLRFSVFRV